MEDSSFSYILNSMEGEKSYSFNRNELLTVDIPLCINGGVGI